MNFQYRPDIDGLRAIAVLSVLFFHTNIPGFSGGYVGVDIFFVISGYLITKNILKDIESGHYSIIRFYERRIRRIFPALFPVIIISLLVGGYLFDASAFKDLGQSVVATTFFFSNFFFLKGLGYFELSPMYKPLLHTWSLAVEEQFYILFPLILGIINKYLKGKYFICLMILFLLSLIGNFYITTIYPKYAFYLMPTRSWELILGSIIALKKIPDLSSDWQKNTVTIIGLLVIIYTVVFYSEYTVFPGTAALLPVIGSGLIIYSGRGGLSSSIQKILSSRILVFIGLISYSLYLWHWPLLVYAKCLVLRTWNIYDSLVIILLSFVMASLSWKYIEQPFRGNKMMLPDRKKLFAVALVTMIIAGGAGITVNIYNGMVWRYPKGYHEPMYDPPWKNFKDNHILIHNLKNGSIPQIVGKSEVVPSYVIWGDSHASALLAALSDKGNEYGISGYNIGQGNNLKPLLGVSGFYREYYGVDECEQNQSVIDFIRKHPEIKVVILASYWGKQYITDKTGEYSGIQPYHVLLRAGLFRTVKELHGMGKKIVIVRDVPYLKDNPKRIYFTACRLNIKPGFDEIAPTIYDYNERNYDAENVFTEIQKKYNVTMVDPQKLFFLNNKKAIVIHDGYLLYDDDNHLSDHGSHFVAPAFDALFKDMARNSRF